MKRIVLIVMGVIATLSLSAQNGPAQIPSHKHKIVFGENTKTRAELHLPKVNGYTIYKADLHTHTIYSDAQLTPRARVEEAYYDGMDFIAITDHMEYRTNEAKFLKATEGYHKTLPEPINALVSRYPADNRGFMVDLNISWREAQKYGERFDVVVIPGVEISREQDSIGHFNALFIKDINKIYDADPEKTIRNARKQGALIVHNHPMHRDPETREPTSDKNKLQTKLYADGLIDGIELVNGYTFVPKLMKRCLDEKLFMVGATDAHSVTAPGYAQRGYFRTCTFVLANERTPEALREALEQRRTMAYVANNVIGEQQLLKDLFLASVRIEVRSVNHKGERTLSFTNTSSIPFEFRHNKHAAIVKIEPFHTVTLKVAQGKNLAFSIMNMWCSTVKNPDGTHPYLRIKLDGDKIVSVE